ncbi:MAG: FMN-binding protein, partial [Ruminococcus sp.]
VSDTETVTTCETTTVTTTAPNQIIDDVNTSYETETVEESEESDIAELPEEENSFDEQAVISEEEDIQQPEESVENDIIEPQYIYNNGTFSASSYGYDGEVYITITIENDVITSITGYTDESDSWYYESASGQIIPSILNTQDTYADVYSGATYSSNAIMDAVRTALESAKK